MNIIYKIKCRLSEAYRIRNGFGLSPIRSEKELEALIDFCAEQLNSTYVSLSSPVWERTVEMYDDAIAADYVGEPHHKWVELRHYIVEHCGEYWS